MAKCIFSLNARLDIFLQTIGEVLIGSLVLVPSSEARLNMLRNLLINNRM